MRYFLKLWRSDHCRRKLPSSSSNCQNITYENGGVRRITLKQLSKYIPTNYVSFTFRAKILFIGFEK